MEVGSRRRSLRLPSVPAVASGRQPGNWLYKYYELLQRYLSGRSARFAERLLDLWG
jgi:hypothetical protein